MNHVRAAAISACLVFAYLAFGAEIQANSVRMSQAPSWLTEARVQRVTVVWHLNQKEFETSHGFGPSVLALAKASDNSVHIGPRVDSSNFDKTFGHELVHVILYQKYKTAIPKWLEEGLASQSNVDITSMTHPFKGSVEAEHHDELSTAVMEMIASKCPLHDLLQLSVGKSLMTYLNTFCGIPDVSAAFADYLKKKVQ